MGSVVLIANADFNAAYWRRIRDQFAARIRLPLNEVGPPDLRLGSESAS
jgi:hypothetical protein